MNPERIAHPILLAWGWRRCVIALIAGAATTLALPPFALWPVPFLTFPVLVWLIDGSANSRTSGIVSAAIAGWCFGFGYFVTGVYWIGHAFLVDAKVFGWLLPFAVLGLPAYLALFTALGTALARALWLRGPVRLVALAAALTASEWLRGQLLTGFPWNSFGYAFATPLTLAQSSSLIGIWGLTFVAVAVYASPAALADDRTDTPRRWLTPALAAATVVLIAAFGFWRLQGPEAGVVDGVRLRIMQPNLQQNDKFNYAKKQEVMDRYVSLSGKAPGFDAITHLIWPESAFPFFLTREADALRQIGDLLPDGAVLVTGGVRAPETSAPGAPILRAYNSVYVLDDRASVLSVYDKVHLVPFGEYLPLQTILEGLGLSQLTQVRGGFIAGDRRRSLTVPGAPQMLPLVCYEVIFPGEAVPRGERPGWMLNLTNDGWFGISTGPYQHLQQARMRAIEQGLPLVRAANTGISAVIDPYGRIIRSLPLGADGTLDSALPQALPPTAYARWGDTPALLLVGVAILLVLRLRRRPV